MKKTLLIISVSIITLLSSNDLHAQFTYESAETFNRVLLFKYADSADQEVRKKVLDLFKGMRKKIEGLEWVHIVELSSSSQGFDEAITLTFKLKSGLEEYETHPDHLRIKEIAPAIVKDFASYEYWEKM